jgi:hypothetical protein
MNMPESVRNVVETDQTRNAICDLMDIPEFWEFLSENWSKDLNGRSIAEWVKLAILRAMWQEDRKVLFAYIVQELNVEDAKTRRIRELEAELEKLRNSQ